MMNRNPIYTVSTYTESFGLDMPKDSIVFCMADASLWVVTVDAGLSDTLNSVTKTRINPSDTIPSGSVSTLTSDTIPSGWLLCNGQAVSRSTYSDLFAVVSTLYGSGDGSTTFNIPDFRGAFLRGAGSNGSYTMANSSAFTGGSLGSFEDDKMQKFKVNPRAYGSGSIDPGFLHYISGIGSNNADTNGTPWATFILSDGYGNPRLGSETKPFSGSINYIIKT